MTAQTEAVAIEATNSYRVNMGSLSDLMHSIKTRGQLHPVILSPTGEVLWGSRRLAACKALNIPPFYRIANNLEELEALIITEGPHHRPMTLHEQFNHAARLHAFERPNALKRQDEGRRRGAGMPKHTGPARKRTSNGIMEPISRIIKMGQSSLLRGLWVYHAAHEPNASQAMIDLYWEMIDTEKISPAYEKARGTRPVELSAPVKPTVTDAAKQRAMMEKTNIQLAGICMSLEQIRTIADDITPAEARAYWQEFSAHRRVLETLIKNLKNKENQTK